MSSFLFETNFKDIVQSDVKIADLLNSNVFSMKYEFDGWPGIHNNDEEMIRPMNGSPF